MKTKFLTKSQLKKINFGKIGNNVLIDEYVNITQPENVFIENNVCVYHLKTLTILFKYIGYNYKTTNFTV